MATTTNYSWTTPDDTDLVKDGAAAIRTLGSSADTTVKDLNPGTTAGDIDYYTSSTAKARVAIGTAGQVLKVNGGGTAPEWATTADQTPLTTKGDLFTFDTADARLGVGANGTVLTADSAETTGLKWAVADSGAFTELASGTLSGASLDLTSISGSYRHLQLILRNYDPVSSNSQLRVRFNNDSTASRYVSYDIAASAGSAYNLDYIDLVGYQVDTPNDGLVIIDVPDYANASTWKTLNSYSMSNNAGTPANLNFYQRNGFYNQTAAIDRVTVFPNTGNFAGGTYSLYGVK